MDDTTRPSASENDTMERLRREDTSSCRCEQERTQEVKIKSKRFGRGAVESGLTHECGVFGAIGTGDWPTQVDIGQVICLGLVALQHRGQESAGIVTSEGKSARTFNSHKGMGLINNIFNDEAMKKLKGNLGIGHTRYSTSAASEEVNCQPFVVHTAHGALAVAHNGELVNCSSLRKMVLGRGVGLSTHSDSELITQALCLNPPEGETNGPDWPARINNLMRLAPLSYSLVIMLKDKIYAVRDPYGNRPLCLGKILPLGSSYVYKQSSTQHAAVLMNGCSKNGIEEKAEGWVVSSESCGFLSIGARYVREVLPGEIVEMSRHGIRTITVVDRPADKQQAFCIFEYVYFARSDSMFEGQMVYSARMQCGRMLARESPVDADIVSSVPESGTAAAHGYARQSGIPFMEVLCKNRYVGRTFIQPSTRLRQLGVAKKFGALSENVRGKRIVLIDDSIVRGNTIGPIIKLLRDAGANEVHIRIASPPLKYPCYMGINIPTREELIANKMDSFKLAEHVGADSLEYLSVEGLVSAVHYNMKITPSEGLGGHCTACLTGEYPGGLPEDIDW
ncbi:amidophosphoribosyltransferase-like isoform X1 [Plodia interpunctella]|uniref:amidophosphoribosyltransferase-like isoform X1 n=1 Tax=Plodia interpunctella TaxID=58824 RepID=UPI00236750E8|nr:amidophosphoribosyltransferase-like isoform X1 [Plodia interpunctella]XP_053602052.1 amidophosphoribosyltransferase-like isoform X1 [Plodia interpunctella]XP_053602053.1 amidophosphoribosyltransferase-like isoform X1 [Plodia interpunctella]XP_053602054.1 amidophosphoribosyltransferase-like isoform X1 [Plodia interpunctella]XP_053602055.1 amidophosphoribosyltransferase-like isoform X1 [Plodia interpunctella]XP_053602056.1 amidophosphoribosyltransferase-like isoform X1 [Plodia interpunctella]